MFSNIAKQVMKTNHLRFKCLYTWETQSKLYKKIGIKKKTISIYKGVLDIKFNDNVNIKKGDILFEVETMANIKKKILANTNCIIIEKNKKIMKTINFYPENKEKSWILKINNNSHGTFVNEKKKPKKTKKFL